MIAFGGVVVDNIEDDFDAGVMQPRHGRSKCIERSINGVAHLGREKAQRIVAPVVTQPALDQMPIVDIGVDRQQFQWGGAQTLEVIDHRRCRKAAICAAPSGGHILAKLRQSLNVGFVDDRVLPRDRGSEFFAPGKGFVDDHALRHSTRVVAPVEREVGSRAAGAIAEMRIAPDQAPCELLRIGIDEQLVRIEAQSALGMIRAVNPVTVQLSRCDIAKIAVPDILGALRQRDALDLAPAMAIE